MEWKKRKQAEELNCSQGHYNMTKSLSFLCVAFVRSFFFRLLDYVTGFARINRTSFGLVSI